MIVPAGKYGRHIEFPLSATYITIHSTDNPNATALEHARGMAVGAFKARTKWNRTGYMTWHFTVDDVVGGGPLDALSTYRKHHCRGVFATRRLKCVRPAGAQERAYSMYTLKRGAIRDLDEDSRILILTARLGAVCTLAHAPKPLAGPSPVVGSNLC